MSLEFGSIAYLRSAAPGDSTLIPGRVLWVNGHLLAVEIERDQSSLEESQTVLVHYEESHTFVQQLARIEGIIDREGASNPEAADLLAMDVPENSQRIIIVIQLQGQPELADHRECFRVKTHHMNVQVEFGSSINCSLADVSQSGFAVITGERLAVGKLVKVTMPGRTGLVTGMVRIQSVREQRRGHFRYGTVAVGTELRNACQYLSMELQRIRLRRLAGHVT